MVWVCWQPVVRNLDFWKWGYRFDFWWLGFRVFLENRSTFHHQFRSKPLTTYGCYNDVYNNFVSFFGMCITVNGLKYEDFYRENTIVFSPIQTKNKSLSKTNYIGKNLGIEKMTHVNSNQEIRFLVVGKITTKKDFANTQI